MSHTDPRRMDFETLLPKIKQLLDDRAVIVPTENRDQTIHSALCSLREQNNTPSVDQLEFFERLVALLRSPVTRLPPEILAYIFEIYVSNGTESTPVYVSAHSPFRLVQVCKYWKTIAESDPRLWTSIHLYYPDSHAGRQDDVPMVEPVFDLHLKRSGALPISLIFADHRSYESATENLVSFVVDRLRKHADRWKRISLHLSCGYFPTLFTFTPCELSSLEHLHISGDVPAQRITFPIPLSLNSATNLKSFTYSGPGHSADDQIDLHWENLKEVSFEYVPHSGQSSTLSRQLRHLAQCQNITSFSLGIDRPFWRIPNSGQPIILPCLQTLRVRRLSPQSHASAGINPLILPQLQTLEIDASVLVGWNQRWHDRTFSNLLIRSACSLCHLSVQDVDFPSDELVRCLVHSPSLTSFRFIPCPRSQDIRDLIRHLEASPTGMGGPAWGNQRGPVVGGPLVPQLREITLASSAEGHLVPIMRMLRSRTGTSARAAGVATLRRAEVVFFDLWHDTDVSRVSIPSARLGRVADLRTDLERWVSENKHEHENETEDKDTLEASVVVDSPYLPEYISV